MKLPTVNEIRLKAEAGDWRVRAVRAETELAELKNSIAEGLGWEWYSTSGPRNTRWKRRLVGNWIETNTEPLGTFENGEWN